MSQRFFFSFSGNTLLWFQPSCVCTQQSLPLIPEEPTQAVKQARLWDTKMKRAGVTICQPSPCPPVPCWSVVSSDYPPTPKFSLAHLKSPWQPDRPCYSSRLAGGYLFVWQPTCHYTQKKSRGGGCLSVRVVEAEGWPAGKGSRSTDEAWRQKISNPKTLANTY